MGSFKAIVVNKSEAGQSVALSTFDENDLMEGDVTFRVEWSTLNYKDGLALTGKSPVVRRFPMIPGIDGAGIVETSSHPDWKAGDKVILNGWGCGETHLGMYAQKARAKGDWLVPLPSGMSTRDAMAIGTAGYTAMLAVLALERHGLKPANGPIVVTGAAGGVGSVAIAILAKLGYHVIASTGRSNESDYLKKLGAAEIIARADSRGHAASACEGALGRRHRHRWIDATRECAVDDEIWWCGRGLRAGSGYGPTRFGCAVHSAWCRIAWHRFGDVSPAPAAAGVDTACGRPRSQ